MPSVLPLNEQLCFALYSATLAVTRAYKPLLDALGITYPQYLVLHALWEEDGRTVGAISERLALEPSTVTPLVTRLERAKLVRRARDPEDERRVRIWLTESGHDIRASCAHIGEALAARSGMLPEQLARLNEEVRQLRDALACSMGEKSRMPLNGSGGGT